MKRSRIKRISQKMRKQRLTERDVKLALLGRDGGCRGRLVVPEVACSGPLDKDEIKARGRGGDAVDLNNTQLLCRYGHHHWKHHVDPEGAVERGLSLHSWDPDPTEPPGSPASGLPRASDFWGGTLQP